MGFIYIYIGFRVWGLWYPNSFSSPNRKGVEAD